MMDGELDWMEQVGNAVATQQADVMDAIQRLRHQAAAAGTLWSNAEQQVTTQRQGIVIEPVNPEFIYPPVYSPAVYGPWPYPDYPAFDISPDNYSAGFPLPFGIGFGVGFAVVQPLWRWCAFDWAQRRIQLDTEKFNTLNHHRAGVGTDTWRHDLGHRPSALYDDPASRTRFRPTISAGAVPRMNVPSTGGSASMAVSRSAPPALTAGRLPTAMSRSAPGFAAGGRGLEARTQAQPGLADEAAGVPSADGAANRARRCGLREATLPLRACRVGDRSNEYPSFVLKEFDGSYFHYFYSGLIGRRSRTSTCDPLIKRHLLPVGSETLR
jgi:hypothetical protein